MDFLFYVGLGTLTGMIGALLGLGGGVIIVPYLVFVSMYEPKIAIGTSMLVVLFNAMSGAYGYVKERLASTDAAIKFSLATIPGAFLGSYAASFLQGKLFYGVFGLFFLGLAINMYIKSGGKGQDNGVDTVPTNYNWKLGVFCSIFVGFLASVLGIGGGVIHVPFMIYVLRFPVRVAIATSTCILAISALAGVASHAYLGHINYLVAVAIGIGAAIGAQLGVKIAKKLKSNILMKGTSVLVALTAIKFLMTALS